MILTKNEIQVAEHGSHKKKQKPSCYTRQNADIKVDEWIKTLSHFCLSGKPFKQHSVLSTTTGDLIFWDLNSRSPVHFYLSICATSVCF